MKSEKPIRTAVYCRVSTAADLQDGSFEMQCTYFRTWVQSQAQMRLVDVYGDHGKSGRSIEKRPAFMRLLQDCNDGKIDLIVTKSVSRFARNLAECIQTVRKLQAKGTAVLFEKEALNTGSEKNELFLCILATMAQEESSSISSHIAWSRRKRAAAGSPYGTVAYGYRGGKAENHIWRTHADEAKRVRLAFEMANRGTCYQEIRAALQALENAEGTGKTWSQYNLLYMLRNEYYTGDYVVNKTCEIETAHGRRRTVNNGLRERFYIETHHEALVSRRVFERVQQLIKAGLLNSKKQNYNAEEIKLLQMV